MTDEQLPDGYHFTERTPVDRGRSLWVAALGEATEPADSFLVSVRFGYCHDDTTLGFNRTDAETLHRLLGEALAAPLPPVVVVIDHQPTEVTV